jgi:hypothetical protein
MEEIQKKRRGRKPKLEQEVTQPSDPTQEKKRGRRPKKKDLEVTIIKPQIELPEEELILHIPINLSKFENKEEQDAPLAANSFENYSAYEQIEEPFKRDITNTVENLLEQFYEANKKNIWPAHTNVYCWWCCHPFNTQPVSLPIRLHNDKFELMGCFCSYNCACSYNNSFSGGKVAERNSLLHTMYRKLHNVKNVIIKPAPPKEILTIFGGKITIDEYRKESFINNFNVTINYPPLISIIPQMEIISTNQNRNNFVPINTKKIETIEKNKKVKMTTTIKNSKNTIDSYMKISQE